MPRMSRLGKVLVGSGFAGAFFWCAPAAGAQELPNPVIDSAGFIDGVREDLAQWGIQTPEVDPAVTESVDEAVKNAVPGAVGPEDPAPATYDPALSARQSSDEVAQDVAAGIAETADSITSGQGLGSLSATDPFNAEQGGTTQPEAGQPVGAEPAGGPLAAKEKGAGQPAEPAADDAADAVEQPASEPTAQDDDGAVPDTARRVADQAQPNPLAEAQWFLDNAKKDPVGAAEFVAREATQPEFRPLNADPFYHWRNDGYSKFMAGKPEKEFVLNRVPGSYFDAPETPVESGIVQAQGKSLYGPGTPVFVGDDMICTLAVAGNDAAGRKVGLTAGHCGNVGESVVSMDSPQVGPSGTVAARNDDLDYSVVELGSNAEVARSYNGLTVNDFGAPSQPGEEVTKQGVASGKTTGKTLLTTEKSQIAQLCAMPGDSGAPVVVDGKLVGLVNGGLIRDFACRTPLQGTFHAPTYVTNAESVVEDLNSRGGVGAGFTLPAEKDFTRRSPEEEAQRVNAVTTALEKVKTQQA